ncbi:MAG: MFS transporter [Proteobacteria bacterium]|nr:MFS transporter [Pseudomonadota bacterium]
MSDPAPAPAAAVRPSGLKRFAALAFTYFAVIGLFNPYAPLWFQSLGLSTIVIGGIASLQSWTRILAPYGWSWAGDASGRRVELIRLAALGCVLSALGLLGVREAVAVSLVTMLLYLSNAGVVPLYEASLAHLLGSSGTMDLARYGRVRMWGSVGFIASVTLFGALLDLAGIGVFPWFAAAMNLLMLVAALRLPRLREDVQAGAKGPAVLQRLRDPEVAWIFASIFFTVLAHSGLYAFFSLYLVALGYDKSAVGALWALAAAVEIGFFWTQGRWHALLAPERWLQVVAVATTLRFAAIAAGGRWPLVLVAAQLSHAVTFAAHHAACIALVHKHFPGQLRGRGQALYTILGYGISGLLGGVGGGWIIEHLGFAALFWIAAATGLVALGCSRRVLACQARTAGVR